MGFGLLNWFSVMGLIGLAGLAIPIIIHLLNRRRFDVIDWGAMRFLVMSETTRRRVFIEEVLLMLLRMGLIALLAIAMCAPFVTGAVFEKLGFIENRDVVLVFDGSTAMSYVDDDGKTAHVLAVEWSEKFIGRLTPGDTVSIVQAREQPLTILEPSSDLSKGKKSLADLAEPAGVADWPAAVEAANRLFSKTQSHRTRRDIILLSASRKTGWSDKSTIERWEQLAPQLAAGKETPRIWVVPFAEGASESAPNWSLTPLHAKTVGTDLFVQFGCSLRVQGQQYKPPFELRYDIDLPPGSKHAKVDADRLGGKIDLPPNTDLRDGRLSLTFPELKTAGKSIEEITKERNQKKLPGPGSHLVTVSVVPDDPAAKRDDKEKPRDRFAADNRRDFAVMVPLVPVLLVDGLPSLAEEYQGADFLQVALQPFRGRIADAKKKIRELTQKGAASDQRTKLEQDVERWESLLVRAKVEPQSELEAALKRDVGLEKNTPPRILVLCDVPSFSEKQRTAIEAFLDQGGSVLVTVGPRAVQAHYNRDLFRNGTGWLPAKLDKTLGDENEPVPSKTDQPDRSAHPEPAKFKHAALTLFAERSVGGIDRARFPKWWQLSIPTTPFRFSDKSFAALREAEVPQTVLTKLADLKGKEFETQDQVVETVSALLDKEEREKYQDLVLKHTRAPAAASVIAELLVRDPKPERSPWLIEKAYGKGRVIMCSVPLDDSWGTNFHTRAVTEYALLANNLISYLAGPRVTVSSLAPGLPIVYTLLDDERGSPTRTTVKPPRGDEVKLDEDVATGTVTHKDTRLAGVYVLTTPRNRTVYFVVQATQRDDDLTPWTEKDQNEVAAVFEKYGRQARDPKLAAPVKLKYGDDATTVLKGPDRDVWWLMLVGVTLLLCSEVWMTRRIAKGK